MAYLYTYFHFFSAILFLILSAIIVIRDFKSRLNQACAGILFCFFIWSLFTAGVHHPLIPESTARWFGRIASIGWLSFSTFHIWFAWLYTKRKPFRYMKLITVIFFIHPLVLIWLQWAKSVFIAAYQSRSYGWFTPWEPTWWPKFWFIYLTGATLTAFWLIFDYGRKSDNGFVKRQSMVIIVTGLISMVSGFVFNIFFSLFIPEGLPPIGDITSLVWAGGLTYVAIRYNMLNITPFIAANRIIATMKDLLFLLDTHGRVISVNSETERVLGCRTDQITGRHFSELIDENDKQRAELPDTILRQSEFNTETVLSFTSSKSIPVALSTSLIPGTGVVCVAHDISLQKQRTESLKEAKKLLESKVAKSTEELYQINHRLMNEIEEKNVVVEALKESEERFRIIFEYAPDGIYLIDQDGNFIAGNNEALRIIGHTKNEMAGKNLFESGLLSLKDTHKVAEMIVAQSAEGTAGYREFTLTRGDGSEIPVETSSHQLVIGEKCLNVCIVRDLSQRKEAENEAKELRAALHHSQKMDAVGRLAGGIAHDFNNLLGGIIGYAGLLQKRLPEQFSAESEVLEKIIHVSKQAAERTAQLLAFARKGKYNVEPVNMHTIITEIINLMRHTIDPKISLISRFDAMRATVEGDRSQLHSAFLNLGLNGRDALPDGGIIEFSTEIAPGSTVEFSDIVEGPVPEKMLKIVVKDNGIGMDEETISRVFEPFFSTKAERKGTGLGLPSVYGTIKQHNGYIHVSSEIGKGTEFVVYLPLADEEEHVEDSEKLHCNKEEAHAGTILVVDDTPLIREMIEEALIDVGYSVHACEDGREALQWYQKNHGSCDLVILDYTMPGLNGKECFEAMKQIHPSIKAILTSGHAVDGEIGKTLQAGAYTFLQKPFECEDLTLLITQVLSGEK